MNRDIIYILYGITAVRSLKSRIVRYKEFQQNYLRAERPWTKLIHYVPVLGSPLVFGFQVKIRSFFYFREECFKIPYLINTKSRVVNYFFQFFLPNSLLFSENAYDRITLPLELPNGISASQILSSKEVLEISSNDDWTRENNSNRDTPKGYKKIHSYSSLQLQSDIKRSKERLSKLLNTKILINTNKSLLFNFLKNTEPIMQGEGLSDIWEYYKDLDKTGIEILRQGKGKRPYIAVYSASLYGFHIITKKKMKMEYLEKEPQYACIPLFDKVKELSVKYPDVTSLMMDDIDEQSWFGAYWAPIVCVPQVKITGRFLTLHKLTEGSRIAVDCCNLESCDYWKDIQEDLKIKEFIKEEKSKTQQFLNSYTDC